MGALHAKTHYDMVSLGIMVKETEDMTHWCFVDQSILMIRFLLIKWGEFVFHLTPA